MEEKGIIFPWTFEEIKAIANENLESSSKVLETENKISIKLLNCHLNLLKSYWPFTLYGTAMGSPKSGELVEICLVRSLFRFYSCITLAQSGQPGSSQVILRQIFEYLIIAKYVIVSGDEKFMKYWNSDGSNINVDKQILNKIIEPSPKPLKVLYHDLCELNHATNNSMSGIVNFEFLKDHIKGTFSLIYILQVFTHHLLNSHFIDRKMKNYMRYYLNEKWVDLTREVNLTNDFMRKNNAKIGTRGRKAINVYCTKWKFK